MGIDERRERERQRRRADIIAAAWRVAERLGWARFSVEAVAEEAELGRATVYGYFESLEAVVLDLGRQALAELGERLANADGLEEALDAPVRSLRRGPRRSSSCSRQPRIRARCSRRQLSARSEPTPALWSRACCASRLDLAPPCPRMLAAPKPS